MNEHARICQCEKDWFCHLIESQHMVEHTEAWAMIRRQREYFVEA